MKSLTKLSIVLLTTLTIATTTTVNALEKSEYKMLEETVKLPTKYSSEKISSDTYVLADTKGESIGTATLNTETETLIITMEKAKKTVLVRTDEITECPETVQKLYYILDPRGKIENLKVHSSNQFDYVVIENKNLDKLNEDVVLYLSGENIKNVVSYYTIPTPKSTFQATIVIAKTQNQEFAGAS